MAFRVEITFMRQVNWSLLRAGIPLVWRLALRNVDSSIAAKNVLRVTLPNYMDSGPIALPAIRPGKTCKPGLSWIRCDFDTAMRIQSPQQWYVRLEIGDYGANLPVELLTPDEWCPGVGRNLATGDLEMVSTVEVAEATFYLPPGGTVSGKPEPSEWRKPPPLQVAAASLVLTEASRVVEIQEHAATLLEAVGERFVAMNDYAHGDSAKRRDLAKAVFTALWQLAPGAFHATNKFSLQSWSQRIRLAHEALSEVATERHGATCVDYALLLCAVLEACGLKPLFLMVGTGDGCHAMVGCWLEDVTTREPLLLSKAEVQQHVSHKRLLVVDVTELARGKGFQESCTHGEELLRDPFQLLYALDLCVIRDRYQIAPLPFRVVKPSKQTADVVHLLRAAPDFQQRPEYNDLVRFWMKDKGGVLGLVGIGGAGKTALMWRFLSELPGFVASEPAMGRHDLPKHDKLFVWSFYDYPKSEDFLRNLFRFVTGSSPSGDGLDEELRQIQVHLAREQELRTLLVLDGVEKLQDQENDVGQFVNEARPVRTLLRWVAQTPANVWATVTSRFPLSDLSNSRGRGYYEVEVGQLPPGAARALLRARGVVTGEDYELDQIADEYGRHALTLDFLGGLLADYYGGDHTKALELSEVITDPRWPDPQQARLVRVLASYEQVLTPEETVILKVVSAFPLPVDVQSINRNYQRVAKRHYEAASHGQTLLPSVARLTGLRLLQKHPRPKAEPRFSAHPTVSWYFYDALQRDGAAPPLHEGAAEDIREQLRARGVTVERSPRMAVRTRGAVRVRGTALGATTREYPTDPCICDLFEELIFHELRAGNAELASRIYQDQLGGFEHLGKTLADYARGERITGWFLRSDGEPLPAALRESIRADHQRYLQRLKLI